MANAGLEIDDSVKDCKTKDYLKLYVSKNRFKSVQERYQMVGGKPSLITDSSDIIDKVIKLRSPIYCKAKNGICPVCYGDHWKKMNTKNIGILAGGAVNVVALNALMKQKHKSSQVEYVEVNFNKLLTTDKERINLFLKVDKDTIQAKLPCSISINKADYSEESLIDAGEYFLIPGIFDICIDLENSEFITLPFNFQVKLYKPTNYYEEGKICFFNYEPGEKMIFQDYYIEDIDPATIDRLFGGQAKYITKPEMLLDALSEKLNSVDLVHLELIVSNMFRDKENETIPARLGSYDNCVIVGQKKLPHILSWLTALSFENIKKSLKFAIIDGTDAKENPIEKLLK